MVATWGRTACQCIGWANCEIAGHVSCPELGARRGTDPYWSCLVDRRQCGDGHRCPGGSRRGKCWRRWEGHGQGGGERRRAEWEQPAAKPADCVREEASDCGGGRRHGALAAPSAAHAAEGVAEAQTPDSTADMELTGSEAEHL